MRRDGVDGRSRAGRPCDASKASTSSTPAIGGRPVAALLANAGRGLGKAFLDQDFDDIRHVIDTNVTGTIYLIHKVGARHAEQGDGRILITGSIAGFMPGSFQAVYNGTKAFLNSFSFALREELKDTRRHGDLPDAGRTETEFFERADMLDTKVGAKKRTIRPRSRRTASTR